MRVLLFSNDLMPFGDLPTSGGGLRCWQLMKGLEAHGIEVLASMPGFTYLAEKHYDKIPEAQRELLWRWETQEEILKRTKPDAVLYASNWDHYGLSKKPDCPLIIDLHGSRLIETSMWDDPVDTDRKVKIFGQADCLLCAGTRQRSYFYGWLMQAGRVPADEHFIRYIPVSLSSQTPSHDYPEAANPHAPIFVSGGGWFPWQNQAKTIFHICKEIQTRDAGTIEIFGTPHETQGLSAEERFIRDVYAQVKSQSDNSPRINVNGYIGRDQLLGIYRRASVAVEAMQYNLERELAFTTRTIEYLWCGLPVLYNNFGEVGEHIAEYDAGWTVDADDEASIATAVREIFERPDLVKEKGINAQRLVRERFSWETTILPLLDFLQNPVRAKEVQPALGPVCARASFLAPGGASVDLPVSAKNASFSQSFVVPAENISVIEVPVALRSITDREKISGVQLCVRSQSGKRLAKKTIPGAEVPVNGRLAIHLPLFVRPSGGDVLRIEIKCIPTSFAKGSEESLLVLRGLLEQSYPYVSADNPSVSSFKGKTLLGHEIDVKAIAISFHPGAGRYYRFKSMCERASWMVKNGDWERLWKAGARRVPSVVHKVKQLALR